MNHGDARSRVKRLFGLLDATAEKSAIEVATPPEQADVITAAEIVQLNIRVPLQARRRIKLLAARDQLSVTQVVMRALELYEEKFGATRED